MTELKKCPFCGGEAEFFRVGTVLGDCVVVKCKNCKARTDTVLFDARKHPSDEEYDEAAALWNNRKPVDDVLEKLESLKMAEYDDSDEEPEFADAEEWFDEGESSGKFKAYGNAIEIIKEELGGLTDV